MVLQSIILIDLCYLAGIKMVKKYDAGESQYGCYLIMLSILAFVLAIGLNILGYVYFQRTPECQSTLWVNILTSIILIILPVIQFLHLNPQNSLLTTSLVSLYVSYLLFIGQFSFGDEVCVRAGVGSLAADFVCSSFVFGLCMYGSIVGGTGQVRVTRDGDINKAMGLTTRKHNIPSTN